MAEAKVGFQAGYEDSDRQLNKQNTDWKYDNVDKVDPEELIVSDNFYKFEEENAIYDPRVQPFSYFYLTITGQIEFGEFLNLDGLAIKYAFVSGDDWQLASGKEEGNGQFSFKGGEMHGQTKRMVWNLPFEIGEPLQVS